MVDATSGSLIGKIKMRTHEIATGPLHHDYAFENSSGRLFFDIKMSQTLKMNFKPLRMTAKFKSNLSAPLYSYNFNIVVS